MDYTTADDQNSITPEALRTRTAAEVVADWERNPPRQGLIDQDICELRTFLPEEMSPTQAIVERHGKGIRSSDPAAYANVYYELTNIYYWNGCFYIEGQTEISLDVLNARIETFRRNLRQALRVVADDLVDEPKPPPAVSEIVRELKVIAHRDFEEADEEELLAEAFGIKELRDGGLDTTRDGMWLIEGVMVEGEPMVVGGPFKSLKTSIALDLAVSLATATPFLGQFAVPEPQKVAYFSGESGPRKTVETAVRVATTRGINEDDFSAEVNGGALTIVEGSIPLDTESGLKYLDLYLKRVRPDVLVIDPVYRSLTIGDTGTNPANLFDMGRILTRIAAVCRRYRTTLILVHHSTKDLARGRVMNLADLTHAGFAEFFRQWFLINPKTSFDGAAGRHELVINCGGSAGHSSEWNVTVDEGPADQSGERHLWNVTLAPRTSKAKSTAAGPSKATRDNADKLLAAIPANGDWLERKQLQEIVSNSKSLSAALDHLRDTGLVEIKVTTETNVKGGVFSRTLVRRLPTAGDTPSGDDRGHEGHQDTPIT